MKRPVLSVIICLGLLSGAVQSFVVEAQAPIPNEQFISQGHDETIDHLPFELPERWIEDEWYLPSDRENPEERVFVRPSEESLRLTRQQVQSFDCSTVTDVPKSECEALVALYESANGAGWTDNTNWLSTTTVGNWEGVMVADGYVSQILLYQNNLTGTIPAEMGNLTNLTRLWLAWNQLTGTIPAELGDLTNLENLRLTSNQLTGTIPAELGNLTNLQYLDLESNQLTGTIPAELGNLTNLPYLFLGSNQLSGTIPAELGNLTNLIILRLDNNQLTGTIPAWLVNLTKLQFLYLSGNQLTGTIPAELGNLLSLRYLYLYGNKLSGIIPAELGDLTNLENLRLTSNQLTGTIPAELGNLTNLQSLYLGNNQLTGTIPAELGNLTYLKFLYLDENHLTGTIPASLGNLTNLQDLSLSGNLLSGTIPASLGNLTNLQHLDLSGNFLEGDVPSSFTNLVNLCVEGDMDVPCYGIKETDLGYNLLKVPQPDPPADFLYKKDPDWDQTQGVKGVFQGAAGGTLISNDGRTTLVIPAGAVEGEVTIILKPTPKASGFMSPFVSARNDFEVLAFDANGAAVTQFDQPLTFTLHYEDGDIGMMPEESLAVHYFDVGQRQWIDAVTTCTGGSYTRNPEENKLSLPVCHLTEFAFVGIEFYNYLPLTLK